MLGGGAVASQSERRELKREKRNISLLFLWILILFFIITLLINFLVGGYTWKKLFLDLINAMIGIMIPLVLFNVAFEYFTKNQQNREISDTLAETLMANKQVIDRFSTDAKKHFIKHSTESILGETNGSMLYSTLIQPYLNHKYNFRRNFKYYISYTDKPNISYDHMNEELASMFFASSDYYWVSQELSFIRHLNNINLEDRSIFIGFSYKESTLDALYNRQSFLFRENLWLKDDHIGFLQNLDTNKMEKFVNDILRFKLTLNGVTIQGKVTKVDDEGFYLLFEIPSSIELLKNKEYKFKMQFEMPQVKNQRKFIAVVSEPTHNVEILFSHIQNKVKVIAIPFFDDPEALSFLPNETVKINIDRWVLPRAGVVFIWDEKEEG